MSTLAGFIRGFVVGKYGINPNINAIRGEIKASILNVLLLFSSVFL